MNKLETLVPPLEMCKQIPVGKFADSAFWRVWSAVGRCYILCQRGTGAFANTAAIPCPCGMKYTYPAPTLAEIMNDLPAPTCYRLGVHDWRVNLCNCPASDAVCSRNPATAALRLWLEINKEAAEK